MREKGPSETRYCLMGWKGLKYKSISDLNNYKGQLVAILILLYILFYVIILIIKKNPYNYIVNGNQTGTQNTAIIKAVHTF